MHSHSFTLIVSNFVVLPEVETAGTEINITNSGSLHTPCPESASELYRPSDRRLSTKLVSSFAVNVTDPYGRIIGFLDRSRYFFFQVAPQLHSRG
jgi:hypothetical protein